MSYSRPWNAYRQITTQTASPGQLVLMLYDGALQFLEKALTGFDMDDPADAYETINNHILRTQAILHELNSTLNIEAGGRLAETLRSLYVYMDERLTEANLRKTPDGIRETVRRLTVLRDAWCEMLRQSAQPVQNESVPSVSSLCACV